jgi:hypothetical protein
LSVNVYPSVSAATQYVAEAHETEVRYEPPLSMNLSALHDPLVYVTSSPP